MPERFDDLLSGAAESAARAAREAGADAARRRGRQRRNRRRLAASTMSVALLATVGGVAAVAVDRERAGGAAVGVASASAASSTLSAKPSASVSATAGSASAAASATASGSAAASSASPSAATSSPSSAAVDPNRYVAGAWLSRSQMPLALAGYTDWQFETNTVGTRIGGEVFATGPDQSATWCMTVGLGELSGLGDGLEGGQVEMFAASQDGQTRADGTVPGYAHQAVFFYRDAAHAADALHGLAADFAACKSQVTGIDATTGHKLVGSTERTAQQGDAECWSVLALGTDPDSDILDHDCFVRSGSIIEQVNVEIRRVPALSTVNFTSPDAVVIGELQQELRQY
jgi:hypothetical protein